MSDRLEGLTRFPRGQKREGDEGCWGSTATIGTVRPTQKLGLKPHMLKDLSPRAHRCRNKTHRKHYCIDHFRRARPNRHAAALVAPSTPARDHGAFSPPGCGPLPSLFPLSFAAYGVAVTVAVGRGVAAAPARRAPSESPATGRLVRAGHAVLHPPLSRPPPQHSFPWSEGRPPRPPPPSLQPQHLLERQRPRRQWRWARKMGALLPQRSIPGECGRLRLCWSDAGPRQPSRRRGSHLLRTAATTAASTAMNRAVGRRATCCHFRPPPSPAQPPTPASGANGGTQEQGTSHAARDRWVALRIKSLTHSRLGIASVVRLTLRSARLC